MGNGQSVPGSLYVYAPNKVAPILFVILYAISTSAHVYQCCREKSWRLIGIIPLCGFSFTLGYALRTYNGFEAYIYIEDNLTNLLVYILSQVFIYICPPLLELASYHILGRTLAYIPHLSPLRPKAVLKIFGSIMLVIETLNALGVSLSANPSSTQTTQDLGKYLTLTALGMQVLVIGIFVVLASIFHRRCAGAGVCVESVAITLRTLYISMALIFARCIYRLVEHIGNTEMDLDDAAVLAELSPILRYEAFFYVFEAALMWVNMVVWNVWHPGRYFQRNVYLGSDGVTEIEYEEARKRKWWMRWLSRGGEETGYPLEEQTELTRGDSRSGHCGVDWC